MEGRPVSRMGMCASTISVTVLQPLKADEQEGERAKS